MTKRWIYFLLALPLMGKVLGKRITRIEKGYMTRNIWIKIFSFVTSFNDY